MKKEETERIQILNPIIEGGYYLEFELYIGRGSRTKSNPCRGTGHGKLSSC